jgi:hypothetical protein
VPGRGLVQDSGREHANGDGDTRAVEPIPQLSVDVILVRVRTAAVVKMVQNATRVGTHSVVERRRRGKSRVVAKMSGRQRND